MERRFDFMQYESFDTLEKEAKKKKVGIWSDEDVSKILGDMSTDERILLEQQQEKEYLELQQELLKLAQEKCEKEGICEDIATWVDITQNMTTFSVHAYKDGFIKVSGRTWTELPIEVLFFQ